MSWWAWGIGLVVVAFLGYKLVIRLFAKQLVLGYLRRSNIHLDKMITVKNECLWPAMIDSGSMGLGEGYMHQWYTCDDLEGMVTSIVSSPVWQVARPRWKIEEQLYNLQSISRSLRVAKQHYNIGNDLYNAMLGNTMQYSCAWWEGCKEGDIDAAQTNKLDMLCKKLNLEPGMRVLDIGCGFGVLMMHMIKNYGAKAVGLNISAGQVKEALERSPSLDIRAQDYRDFFADPANEGAFDRIVSVGMFEHVGPKNYSDFFRGCLKVLKKDGLLVLHTIGVYDSYDNTDEWLDKYIFPGAVIPSLASIGAATENVFTMENWINIGPYYATTLIHWRERAIEFFKKQDTPKYDEVFQRMWYFYLTLSAVMFRERELQLWQIVFSNKYKHKPVNPGSALPIEKVFGVYGVKPEKP